MKKGIIAALSTIGGEAAGAAVIGKICTEPRDGRSIFQRYKEKGSCKRDYV